MRYQRTCRYIPHFLDALFPSQSTRQTKVPVDLGFRAHQALSCRDFSRTDIMWGKDGPVLLETNTIPGLTPASLFPKAAEAAGMEFPDLVARLVKNAAKRGG